MYLRARHIILNNAYLAPSGARDITSDCQNAGYLSNNNKKKESNNNNGSDPHTLFEPLFLRPRIP